MRRGGGREGGREGVRDRSRASDENYTRGTIRGGRRRRDSFEGETTTTPTKERGVEQAGGQWNEEEKKK